MKDVVRTILVEDDPSGLQREDLERRVQRQLDEYDGASEFFDITDVRSTPSLKLWLVKNALFLGPGSNGSKD